MNPPPLTAAPASSVQDAPETDLLVYAGRMLETPAGLAQAVLEYAQAMARKGTAEVVTLPIFHDGRPHEVRMLVGGSVPVAALSSNDQQSDAGAVLEDLRARTVSPSGSSAPGDARLADHEYWMTAAYSEWDY